jgi:hypothetical protein
MSDKNRREAANTARNNTNMANVINVGITKI